MKMNTDNENSGPIHWVTIPALYTSISQDVLVKLGILTEMGSGAVSPQGTSTKAIKTGNVGLEPPEFSTGQCLMRDRHVLWPAKPEGWGCSHAWQPISQQDVELEILVLNVCPVGFCSFVCPGNASCFLSPPFKIEMYTLYLLHHCILQVSNLNFIFQGFIAERTSPES